jgi:hypothetical protein
MIVYSISDPAIWVSEIQTPLYITPVILLHMHFSRQFIFLFKSLVMCSKMNTYQNIWRKIAKNIKNRVFSTNFFDFD